MPTLFLRSNPCARALLVFAAAFPSSTVAQNAQASWETHVDVLDDLPSDLTDLRSLEIGDFHGEGTRDMVLRTEGGMIYGYGVGRYAHHAAVADLAQTADLLLVPNAPGLPDLVVTTESSLVRRWQGDATGLQSLSVFDSTSVTSGGRVTAWGQDQMMGLLTVLQGAGTTSQQALSYLTTQPSATRFALDPLITSLGPSAVSQLLYHDLLQVGVPLLVTVEGSTLKAYDVLNPGSTPAVVTGTDFSTGMLCPCPLESGCHPLLWVGRSGGQWVARRILGLALGPVIALGPDQDGMAPIRGARYVQTVDSQEPRLCVAFDDRILITDRVEGGADDVWLAGDHPDLPSGCSNSSPAAFDDVDGDGDLDILVAYGNDPGDDRSSIPGESAVLVWHENHHIDAGGLEPALVPELLFSWDRDEQPGTLAMNISAPGFDSVEVLVFDVPLGVGLSSPLPPSLPQFEPVAVAAGEAQRPDPDATNHFLQLSIPPGVGRTIGGETRLALIELRGKAPASGLLGTPERGPSRFYVGTLDASRLLAPGDLSGGVGGRAVSGPPVRPQVIIPPVQVYRYRPPRRGPRPNPSVAGQD